VIDAPGCPAGNGPLASKIIAAAFALEYAPTVRVNTLSGGPFPTDVSKAWTAGARASSRSAIGHFGQRRPGRQQRLGHSML
jgi:hypothetical protein